MIDNVMYRWVKGGKRQVVMLYSDAAMNFVVKLVLRESITTAAKP